MSFKDQLDDEIHKHRRGPFDTSAQDASRRRRRRMNRRRRSRGTVDYQPIDPASGLITALGSWFRVSLATSDVNGVSSLPDSLNANPAVQSVNARKPTIENSANGLPCLRWAATTRALSLPVIAANSNNSTWGFATWIKPDSIAAGVGMLLSAFNLPGGASANRLRLYQQNNNVVCEVYATASAGRFGNSTGGLTTGWQFVTFEYDDSAATDALKMTFTINGAIRSTTVGNQGGGAAIGSLLSVTGNQLLGEHRNDGTVGLPYFGLTGPHGYVFSSKMAGATRGLLTPVARNGLMLWDKPT